MIVTSGQNVSARRRLTSAVRETRPGRGRGTSIFDATIAANGDGGGAPGCAVRRRVRGPSAGSRCAAAVLVRCRRRSATYKSRLRRVAVADPDRLAATVDAELAVDRYRLRLDGVPRDLELFRDLAERE